MKNLITILVLSVAISAAANADCIAPNMLLKVNGEFTTQTTLHVKKNDLVELGAYGTAGQCNYYFSGKWYRHDGVLLSPGSEFASAKYEGTLYFTSGSKEGERHITVTIIRTEPEIVEEIKVVVSEIIEIVEDEVDIEILETTTEASTASENMSTSIENSEELTPSFSLFPNPAVDHINIVMDTDGALTPAIIQVFNTSGQLVLTQAVQTTRTTLNTSALGSGAYFALVSTNDGFTHSEKFLKE